MINVKKRNLGVLNFEKSVPDCLAEEAVITYSESLPAFEIVTNPPSGLEYDQSCELIDVSTEKKLWTGICMAHSYNSLSRIELYTRFNEAARIKMLIRRKTQ